MDVCYCQRPAAMCWRVRAYHPRPHSGLPRAPGYPCHSRAWRPPEYAPSPFPRPFAAEALLVQGRIAPLTSAETRRQQEAAHHGTSKSTECTEPLLPPILPLQVKVVQKACGVGKQSLVGRLALCKLTVLCVERVVAASWVASVKCAWQCEWIVGCGKWEVIGRCCRRLCAASATVAIFRVTRTAPRAQDHGRHARVCDARAHTEGATLDNSQLAFTSITTQQQQTEEQSLEFKTTFQPLQ